MTNLEIQERAKTLEATIHAMKRHGLAFKSQSGLKNSERQILWLLNNMSKEAAKVKPSDLAKKLNITSGAVTHQINALEKLGLVTRVINPEDRRESWLEFTPKGKEMIATIKANYWKKLCQLVEYLGAEDSDQLNKIIFKMNQFLSND
jgi:DNA-binding MarR family transcriptional regulator